MSRLLLVLAAAALIVATLTTAVAVAKEDRAPVTLEPAHDENGEPAAPPDPGDPSTARVNITICFLGAHGLDRQGSSLLVASGDITCPRAVTSLHIRACVQVRQIPNNNYTDVSCNPSPPAMSSNFARSYIHSSYAGKTCGSGLSYRAKVYGEVFDSGNKATNTDYSGAITC